MLPGNDRRDYVRAVKCLFDTPSKLKQTNPNEYEGVVNRYDDFVATHINLTMTIHGTVSDTPNHAIAAASSTMPSQLSPGVFPSCFSLSRVLSKGAFDD